MKNSISRRRAIKLGVAAAAIPVGTAVAGPTRNKKPTPNKKSIAKSPFRFCLNTSTVRGQKLPIEKIVELASTTGYSGIEPWISEIQAFQKSGRKLSELKKQIADAGLTVESAIGFANWIVDDDKKRAQALDIARRNMETVRAIGGQRIAAPPAGTNKPVDLQKAAERYHDLLIVGDQMGVVPQLELWGFSQPINRLGELMYIAAESAHAKACVLPDIYHIYKGGSDFAGLKMLDGNSIHVFHVNDYPADPPREKISDADRVHVGDGIAPVQKIFQTLYQNGFRGALSLELFNRAYWKQDPAKVAKTGLEKMKKAVDQALRQLSAE